MKKELLSPAGNMESLYQAVHNGADAVYLGGKNFGARMFSDNFTNDELIAAIQYCHLYGVKIYVTANTIIFNHEISDFLKYVEFLYIHGVDALIMQDIGLIALVKEKFPTLEVHASTQVHNYNEEGMHLLEELGVARVVFARELSLEEIANIKIDIEKEIFIHGALCVCFSGCCLFSSMNTERSGNRGECIASCRLPYEFVKDGEVVTTNGKYLLSTKELNTIPRFKEIMDSDVTSLKIEGRMKSPEYVGFITRIYRTLMDKYYRGEETIITDGEMDKLKTLFHREFTTGYLFHSYGSDLMNIKSPNHIGLPIGNVIDVNPKYIKLKLARDLHQEDGIKFIDVDKGMVVNKLYNDKMLLVNEVKKNSIAFVDNKIGLKELSRVAITINHKLVDELKQYELKKIGLKIQVTAKLNYRLTITAMDDKENTVTVFGPTVQKAISKAVTSENILTQVSKLGNTPFKIEDIQVTCDKDIFISLKEINDLRRHMVDEMIKKRTFVPSKIINSIKELKDTPKENPTKFSVLVRTEDQLFVALEKKMDYIYVTDFNLYQKYKAHSHVYLRTERIASRFLELENENILATELGAIHRYVKSNFVCSDYYLNIVNDRSIALLSNLGVKRITLSPEVEVIDSFHCDVELEMIIYGRLELMVTKYCPLNMLINHNDKKCNLCLRKNKYYFRDQNGHDYPIIHQPHVTHIMHHKNIDFVNDMNRYKKMGISCFRIELFDENKQEVEEIIDYVRGAL